jgi:putative addiction module component (TIGR02574 family)
MGSSLKDIEEQARNLSAEDRATLAQSLLESLDAPIGEIETAWAEEIERRVAAYDRGELKTIPAEDVFAEARRLTR